MSANSPVDHGVDFAGKLADVFTRSKLTPLIIGVSVLLGLAATLLLPREEEPQIRVPMMDVYAAMPGADAAEIETRVVRPMEQLLAEIPGVEYVYGTAQPGGGMVIVRFKVGEEVEKSLVKLNQKLATNFDRIPAGVSHPLVKPASIDDVPILALTLHSPTRDHAGLRRAAVQLHDEIKRLPDVAEIRLAGGRRREIRIEPDLAALAARGLAWDDLAARLGAENRRTDPVALATPAGSVAVQTGAFWRDARDIRDTLVTLRDGKPVRLGDVARVTDGPEDISGYTFHGAPGKAEEPAVTLSVAKRPGANAITVVRDVRALVESLRGRVLPDDIAVSVTRDYGRTAAEKSDELLLHMGLAVIGVAAIVWAFLGRRGALVVTVAIPVTLGLTLLVFHLLGYTLNRITLFALIFSIGILVDDAIVVVENIIRHRALPENERRPLADITVEAVREVGNPTILATWAVIGAILPMAFVGGLMGPYMRPIPVGSSAAMAFSLIVAFTVTPWAAARLLKNDRSHHDHHGAHDDAFTRLYHRVMDPLLAKRSRRFTFLAGIVALLLGALALVPLGAVKVKMLPYDNKSELQLIVNLPESANAEQSAAAARALAAALREDPAVADYQWYVGAPSPFNFNGLVRHYYLRNRPHQADIQVNLLPREQRDETSHAVALRLRPKLTAIARAHGARLTVAEVPPGPPVLQTLVAEIYAPTEAGRRALADEVRRLFEATPGVTDIDRYDEAPPRLARIAPDAAKAVAHGLTPAGIARTLDGAVNGAPVALLHDPAAGEEVPVRLRLSRADRATPETLLSLPVRGAPGTPAVRLSEIATVSTGPGDGARHRKNQLPALYVIADVAGEAEGPAYAILPLTRALAKLDARRFGGDDAAVIQHHLNQPANDLRPAVKWDGEWHITLEVFRDLGAAFAAVLVIIYALMVGWFRSFATPLVVMSAIPFSLIGILPAHAAMGAFFTATSMIGFMAGAGIVVRNSIILVDFIELRRGHGVPLAEAVTEAGAVRFRPMLLTALAVIVGAAVILKDPIFQGLAISLLAGEIASLLISRMAVPVLYFMQESRNR